MRPRSISPPFGQTFPTKKSSSASHLHARLFSSSSSSSASVLALLSLAHTVPPSIKPSSSSSSSPSSRNTSCLRTRNRCPFPYAGMLTISSVVQSAAAADEFVVPSLCVLLGLGRETSGCPPNRKSNRRWRCRKV